MYIFIIFLFILCIYLISISENLDSPNSTISDINKEKLKLIEKGYTDIESKNTMHTYNYICDVNYTNIIYCESDQRYITLFDTGNESVTFCSQDFVDRYNVTKYPLYASKDQINKYNKLMDKFNPDAKIKGDTITEIDLSAKIKENFKKIQEIDPNITIVNIEEMIGMLNDIDVFGFPFNITHQVIIPFMIVGTNKKLFVNAHILPHNNSTVLFSINDIYNLSYHGIHIGLHPLFIEKDIKINKLQRMYDMMVHEKTINDLYVDKKNKHLLNSDDIDKNIKDILTELNDEKSTLIDAQIYTDIPYCKITIV